MWKNTPYGRLLVLYKCLTFLLMDKQTPSRRWRQSRERNLVKVLQILMGMKWNWEKWEKKMEQKRKEESFEVSWQPTVTWQWKSQRHSFANMSQHAPVLVNLNPKPSALDRLRKKEKSKPQFWLFDVEGVVIVRYSEMLSGLVEIWRRGQKRGTKESGGESMKTKFLCVRGV